MQKNEEESPRRMRSEELAGTPGRELAAKGAS